MRFIDNIFGKIILKDLCQWFFGCNIYRNQIRVAAFTGLKNPIFRIFIN